MLRLLLLWTALPLLLPAAACPCRLAKVVAQALPSGPESEPAPGLPAPANEHDDPFHHDHDCPGENLLGTDGSAKQDVPAPVLAADLDCRQELPPVVGPVCRLAPAPSLHPCGRPLFLMLRALLL